MKRLRKLIAVNTLFLLQLVACTSSDGNEQLTQTNKSQGVKNNMTTCTLGRFSIKIPITMQQDGRSHRLRLSEIQEIAWPQVSNHQEIRNKEWMARVSEVKAMEGHEGKANPIIEEKELNGLGQWARGIFYTEKYTPENEGKWELLVDLGATGIWIKSNSTLIGDDNGGKMLRNLTNIASAYTATTEADFNTLEQRNLFYLQNGRIDLPYRWEEQSYARFKCDRLGLTLEIEMKETHRVEPKHEGLLARTAAIIATGYATGVDIKRLRSRTRKVAGLDGEEEVDRMRDKYRTAISYGWRYAGKKDSGEYPEIVIRMESPDGKLEEKLKIWDAILDSMKPLYRQ